MERSQNNPGWQRLAPVRLSELHGDAVSDSLAILSTVYNYNHWIFNRIRRYLGGRVVEVGAGIGNITQFLLNQDQVVCLEPFEPYRTYLTERFANHRNVLCLPYRIEDCPNADVLAGQLDCVVCLNVLEHIHDDVFSLTRMRDILAPGGRVIVLVPAMPCLFGKMDRAMGHDRRYSLSSLKRAMKSAGLTPIHGSYQNMLGAMGWWWRGRVLGKTSISARQTRVFDRLVPMLSAIESILPVPFGQSVLVVAEKR